MGTSLLIGTLVIVFLIAFLGITPLGSLWLGSEGSASYLANSTVWAFSGSLSIGFWGLILLLIIPILLLSGLLFSFIAHIQ